MKANYPLPLELTKPVGMSSDLDTALGQSYGVEHTKYNPETQTTMWHRRKENTSSKCVNYGLIQIDDVLVDFTI